MKIIKEKKGITLITLAVTIVVILILAGITIDVTLGENGIINKSKEAAKASRKMYNNNSNVGVESDLINSYAWDTAIVFVQEMGVTNYSNKSIKYPNPKNTGTTGDIACNIYDMCSNCKEWDTEYSTHKHADGTIAYPCVPRGGDYYSGMMTSSRFAYIYTSVYKSNQMGFRVTLYLK